MKEKGKDRWRTLGAALIIGGVGVWAFYAVVKYGLGWDISPRQALPYHLAGVIPGFLLRRRRFLLDLFRSEKA